MPSEQILEQLKQAVEAQDKVAVDLLIDEMQPADMAELLCTLPDADALYLLGVLDIEQRAEVFAYLDEDNQQRLAEQMTEKDLSELFSNMNSDRHW